MIIQLKTHRSRHNKISFVKRLKISKRGN